MCYNDLDGFWLDNRISYATLFPWALLETAIRLAIVALKCFSHRVLNYHDVFPVRLQLFKEQFSSAFDAICFNGLPIK